MRKDQAKINEFFAEHWARPKQDPIWRPYDKIVCGDIETNFLEGAEILDVGAAYNLYKIHLPAYAVTGLDPAFGEVDVQSTIEDYQTDKRYDAVMCANTLHFGEMSEVQEQIDKMISLLKPTGRLYFRLNTIQFSGEHTGNTGTELVNDFTFSWTDEMLAAEIQRLAGKGFTCFRKGYNVDKSRYLVWFKRG